MNRETLWTKYSRMLDRAKEPTKTPHHAGMFYDPFNWPGFAWDAYRAGYREGRKAAKKVNP